MKTVNLFGEVVDAVPSDNRKSLKAKAQYRNATSEELKQGRCCKNCLYRVTVKPTMRTYNKCKHVGFSSSVATDLKLKGICPKFEELL